MLARHQRRSTTALVLVGMFVLGVMGTLLLSTSRPLEKSTVRIVVLGDSNSAADFNNGAPGFGRSWPERLKDELASKYPWTTYVLVNRAVAHRNSSDVLAHLGEDCLGQRPDIVFVMVSTNDAYGDSGWGTFVPIEQTRANLEAIVEGIEKTPSGTSRGGRPLVVLMEPPPAMSYQVYSSKHPGDYVGWRSFSRTVANKNLVDQVAREHGLPLVPTWNNVAALGFDGMHAGHSHYIYDGVHLSDAGRQRLAQWAGAAIGPNLTVQGTVRSR